MKRRNHSKEFKEEAVKLTDTRPVSHVARDLGINHTLLGKWKNQQIQPNQCSIGLYLL